MQPPPAATGSEIDIFRLLERVDAGECALAFTSLNLSDHEYKKWGEIDFVVLMPEGLLAIEVKGGQVYCDARGIWRYESRGKRAIERAESPMAQVSSAYFSLRDRQLYAALDRSLVDAAPSGFGVILARTSARDANERGLIGGTEMPTALVATREDVADAMALSGMLSRFIGHWRDRHRRPRTWTKAEVASIAAAIRPWFDRVVPLSLTAARVREDQLSLTREQYTVLDFSEVEQRLICTGGAGCGKTLLAVECLRREVDNDPVLVTGTESLARHLRSSLVPDQRRVMSFEELCHVPDDKRKRFGCLIVDEGQQLTNRHSLEILSASLLGGLEAGRWRWFCDPNNQIARTSAFDHASHALLEKLAFKGTLGHNCRNTPQIANTVQAVTGAFVGKHTTRGQGPEVIFAAAADRAGQAAAAAKTIRQWLTDPEIAPGEIVLLAPRKIAASSIPEIARLAGLRYEAWVPGWSASPSYRTSLAAATIDEFRGIEAPFVVLCDIDDRVEEPVRLLYLGMTRPNFGLFVMADHGVIARAVSDASPAGNSSTGEP